MAKSGYVKIPKGYLWCDDCNAFTPHKKISNPSSSWQKDYRICVICDKTIEFDDQDCPKCGWRYMQYGDVAEFTVQVHRHGCHCEIEKFDDHGIYSMSLYSDAESIWRDFIIHNPQFKDVEEIKCLCPEYTIYPDPYCYDSIGGHGPGYNCYDEQWWALYIRCPICGERFELEDGNC